MTSKTVYRLPGLIICLAICSISFSSCSNQDQTEQIPCIDVNKGHSERSPIPISKFGESIEYVLLETNIDCQVGDWTNYYLDRNFIIVFGFRRIYVFDRKTGRFLKQIGHYGKDPHSYAHTWLWNAYDYKTKLVRTAGWDLYSEQYYSLESEQEISIDLPWGCINTINLTNGNILGYVKNSSGTDKTRLTEFSMKDTTAIHRVPNYRTFVHRNAGTFLPQSCLYQYGSRTYFYELFTDTVFEYDKGRLLGHLRIELGKFGQSYEQQLDPKFINDMSSFILPEDLCETHQFIFFKYRLHNLGYYYCLYDKENKETWVSNSDQLMIPGFANDIDGFINFPLSTINPDGYAIGAVQALDVIRWMDSTKISAPAGIPNIDKLNEYSNPLVMIVKLKNY